MYSKEATDGGKYKRYFTLSSLEPMYSKALLICFTSCSKYMFSSREHSTLLCSVFCFFLSFTTHISITVFHLSSHNLRFHKLCFCNTISSPFFILAMNFNLICVPFYGLSAKSKAFMHSEPMHFYKPWLFWYTSKHSFLEENKLKGLEKVHRKRNL